MGLPVVTDAEPPGEDLEAVEIELLIEGVFRHYGYDFRGYARASLRRRLLAIMRNEGLKTFSALQDRVLHDRSAWDRCLQGISVNVSAMFRDPQFFLAFRRHAIPLLRTYPFIRIWQAGSSLGEEAYSLAILLHEEGLYERSLIYSTDINEAALRQARDGIYPADLMQRYTQNYIQAGGTRSFSEYYTARYELAIIRPALRDNIVFSQHNLVSDGPFNEFNVVLCRNVMIYFTKPLQDKALALLHASLSNFGLLGVGAGESLRLTRLDKLYEPLVDGQRLYKRLG
ncbi:MAG TPA: protein-glutamate O-methyltransferase CheR [Vicinamibacterales bacterium]|nr:protein-glutamate O-methyltransferase CheR [Vicinamibacterales bacterium]